MAKKELISIVIPCYNEEITIPLYYEAMCKQMTKMNYVDFELIFVNDGSKDKSLEVLRKLAKKDDRVKYIDMSRNFGKEAGMLAGLEYAKGDYITTMDVDLQDPPELLEEMYKGIKEEGYDCIATKSTSRNGYSPLRKFLTKMFYIVIGKLSKTEMVPGARDYRLMTRQMLNAVLDMKEYNRYTKGIFSFVGFKVRWIEYENQERVAGYTKWNFWKLFSYAIDGIVGYSTTLLLLPAFLGILFLLIAFALFVTVIVRMIALGDAFIGYTSLLAFIFFMGGCILFSMGIIGEYLSKTYLETKRRPVYIIRETEKSGR